MCKTTLKRVMVWCVQYSLAAADAVEVLLLCTHHHPTNHCRGDMLANLDTYFIMATTTTTTTTFS